MGRFYVQGVFFKKKNTLSNFQKCEACTYIIRSCFDNSLQDPFPFSHLLFYTLSVLVDPANQKLIIPSGKISHQNSCFPWCDWQTSCHSACHNKANKGYGWITHFHCSGLMPLKYLILFTEIKMILLRRAQKRKCWRKPKIFTIVVSPAQQCTYAVILKYSIM